MTVSSSGMSQIRPNVKPISYHDQGVQLICQSGHTWIEYRYPELFLHTLFPQDWIKNTIIVLEWEILDPDSSVFKKKILKSTVLNMMILIANLLEISVMMRVRKT
jgi:hypothetical protein